MPACFDSLRLLADDLTGALDSAVSFVHAFGPLEVGLDSQEGNSLVLDSATRELSARQAVARVAALAPMLQSTPGRLSFLKVDSLLRGHAGMELAVILAQNIYARVIISAALPVQGRETEKGRQIVKGVTTGEDLAATLSSAGHAVTLRPPGPPGEGITLFDAKTDADLDCIVHEALRLPGDTLWVGTGGLAAALGRTLPAKSMRAVNPPALPLLGLIGTDHPVALEQLSHVRALSISAGKLPCEILRQIHVTLVDHGSIFLSCDLPPGTPRDAAQAMIARRFAKWIAQIPRPGSLFASGGETLRALLPPLGARALRVEAEFQPGMPLAQLVGGRWNGLPILSKSGAFGAPNLLETLISGMKPAGKAFAS